MDFEYVRRVYKVNADMNREVIVDGRRGVITEDRGHHLGVHFYDTPTVLAFSCHPTWRVEYLDTFSDNPPIKKETRSQRRYRQFLEDDSSLSFKQWLGIK